MVRDDQRIRPKIGDAAGVVFVEHAFKDQFPAPHIADPRDLAPIQLRVKLLGRPRPQRGQVFDALGMTDDIAKAVPLGARHARSPAPFRGNVDDIGNCGFGRGRKAVFQIFVTLAHDLQIQRQNQGRTPGFARTVQCAGDKIPVFHHIKLEPKRGRGVGGHIFN